MKTGTKIFLGVIGLLVVTALVVWLVTFMKAKKLDAANKTVTDATSGGSAATSKAPAPNTPPPIPTTKTPAYASLPDGEFPLKKGSKSKLVWLYQYYLNIMHGAGLTLDGSWGNGTEAASVGYTGASVVDVPKAETLLKAVPASKAKYFMEYADLIRVKISVPLGNALQYA